MVYVVHKVGEPDGLYVFKHALDAELFSAALHSEGIEYTESAEPVFQDPGHVDALIESCGADASTLRREAQQAGA